MKYSFFTIFIILAVSILFCSLFLFYSDTAPGLAVIAGEDSQSNMSGTADSSINFPTNVSYQASFPQSDDKKFLPPTLRNEAEEIKLNGTSCLILDKNSNAVLLKNEENKVNAIASITKLVTALIFLEQNLIWENTYVVRPQDIVAGGVNNIQPGDKIKLKDLFFLSLVSSDNSATQALVNSTGLTTIKFVEQMNARMKDLGLKNTSFEDATGLSDNNVSTALEVARIAQVAFSKKEIREATLTKKFELTTESGIKRIAKNTDLLLDIFPQNGIKIVGGKTGFTSSAGYCFVGQFVNHESKEIISVVLGGPDINSRFEETKKLVSWTYNNYLW